jgi:hypothetical protein
MAPTHTTPGNARAFLPDGSGLELPRDCNKARKVIELDTQRMKDLLKRRETLLTAKRGSHE